MIGVWQEKYQEIAKSGVRDYTSGKSVDWKRTSQTQCPWHRYYEDVAHFLTQAHHVWAFYLVSAPSSSSYASALARSPAAAAPSDTTVADSPILVR